MRNYLEFFVTTGTFSASNTIENDLRVETFYGLGGTRGESYQSAAHGVGKLDYWMALGWNPNYKLAGDLSVAKHSLLRDGKPAQIMVSRALTRLQSLVES